MSTDEIADKDLRDAIERAIAAHVAGNPYDAALCFNVAMNRAYSIAHTANFSAGMDAAARIYTRPPMSWGDAA